MSPLPWSCSCSLSPLPPASFWGYLYICVTFHTQLFSPYGQEPNLISTSSQHSTPFTWCSQTCGLTQSNTYHLTYLSKSMAWPSTSASGSLPRLQPRCRLGLWSSEGLTAIEDLFPSSLAWLLAGKLSFFPYGPIYKAAHNRASGAPQRVITSECMYVRPYCFLWTNLQVTPSFSVLLYSLEASWEAQPGTTGRN